MGNDGKSAWVTGGGSGIGLGIAEALARDGYTTFISGRNESKLVAAADDLVSRDPAAGKRLIPFAADVTDEGTLQRVVRAIEEKSGRLDVLVAAAGVNVPHRSFEETTPDEWRTIVDINATGAFLSMKAVLPIMRKQQSGIIVSICSVSGLRALAGGGAAYCASKFAQHSLGVTVGNELSEMGIRVTNIYPGDVRTPILEYRPVPPKEELRVRMVQPEDIGALVSLIVKLPANVQLSDVTIKPVWQNIV